jgi:hypothetical protein
VKHRMIQLRMLLIASAWAVWLVASPVAAAPECDEPNERLAGACRTQLGEMMTGTFASRADVDTYVVSVPTGATGLHARAVCPTVDCDLAVGGVLPNGATETLGESHKVGTAIEADPEVVDADIKAHVEAGRYQRYYAVVNVPADVPDEPWDPATSYTLLVWVDGVVVTEAPAPGPAQPEQPSGQPAADIEGPDFVTTQSPIQRDGTQIAIALNQGETLLLSGAVFQVQGQLECDPGQRLELCVLVVTATHPQTVVVTRLETPNYWYGISRRLTAKDAVARKQEEFYRYPNCLGRGSQTGCDVARIQLFRDETLIEERFLPRGVSPSPPLAVEDPGRQSPTTDVGPIRRGESWTPPAERKWVCSGNVQVNGVKFKPDDDEFAGTLVVIPAGSTGITVTAIDGASCRGGSAPFPQGMLLQQKVDNQFDHGCKDDRGCKRVRIYWVDHTGARYREQLRNDPLARSVRDASDTGS